MTAEVAVASLTRFLRSLAVLAMDVSGQVAWLRSLGLGEPGLADELALEFDDGFLLMWAFVGESWLPAATEVPLREIDRALDAMSGERNAAWWKIDALASDRRWAHVRELARAAWLVVPEPPRPASHRPTTAEPPERTLARFMRSVAVLGLDAPSQLAWVRSLDGLGIANGLSWEFDDGYPLISDFIRQKWLPEATREPIDTIRSLLVMTSEFAGSDVRRVMQLAEDPRWDQIRGLARAVLFRIN